MGTKQNPAQYDCYQKALPDEPMFVLLARDHAAPTAVKAWARYRASLMNLGLVPETDLPMINEALECAEAMAAWRTMNFGLWRKPQIQPQPQVKRCPGFTIQETRHMRWEGGCSYTHFSAVPDAGALRGARSLVKRPHDVRTGYFTVIAAEDVAMVSSRRNGGTDIAFHQEEPLTTDMPFFDVLTTLLFGPVRVATATTTGGE